MAKKGKAKAVFLTTLVLYAGMQGTTLNKSASTNIALTNKPLTATNSVQKEKRQPQEIMFLFEDQYLVPELQEAPKIKKKKK